MAVSFNGWPVERIQYDMSIIIYSIEKGHMLRGNRQILKIYG
jgi:hypothetical protein